MAYLFADATGNFTTAATWKVGNATGTTQSDSVAGSTLVTTTFVSSSAFTPGAITVQALAVKVFSRSGTPSGTFSVRLAQAGVAVAGTTVTINVSDILATLNPSSGTGLAGNPLGWLVLKFATPVTLIAATAYTLQATTSASNMVTLMRDATAANWTRAVITTTTQTPVAGDCMFVVPAWTAATTKTLFTVTLDETATTDYGSTSSVLASLGVGMGCTLQWATNIAGVLRLSGMFNIWQGGIYTQGTASAPVANGSSAWIEFDCAADADFGTVVYQTGSREFCGSPRTTGKAIVQCLLNTDEAAASTVLGVDTDTGWKNGDRVIVGSTVRVRTQTESRTLSGDAGASSVTISAGLTNAHSGTSPTQGEVALLTRNCGIRAVTNAATWFWCDYGLTTFTATWTAFEYFGGGAGITQQFRFQQTCSATFSFCAFANWERTISWNASGAGSGGADFVTFTDCVWAYDTATATDFYAANGYTFTLTRGASFYYGVQVGGGAFNPQGDVDCTVTFHRFCGTGFFVTGSVTTSVGAATIEDCNFHANGNTAGDAIQHGPTGWFPLHVRRCRFWRSSGTPISLGSNASFGDGLFEQCYFIGNTNGHVALTAGYYSRQRFVDCDFESEASFTTGAGFIFNAGAILTRTEWHRCRFSQVTKHTTDISNNGAPLSIVAGLYFINTLLGGTNKFSLPMAAAMRANGPIAYMEEDGLTGAHETNYQHGVIQNNAVVYHTAAPSEEMLPSSALTIRKLESSRVTKALASGQSVTFTVWIRKSAAYNGSQPRIVVEANGSTGWNDTFASYAGGADAWAQVSCTVGPATEDGVALAYIDCDGSAGSVYIDDWAATLA